MSERDGINGGGAVTSGGPAGTSGGAGGTGGLSPRNLRRLLIAMLIAYACIQAAANISSMVADDRQHGGDLSTGFAALYELSSLTGWIALLALISWAYRTLRPPRFSWPVSLLLHAAMTVPVSLGHVAIMFAIRFAVFAMLGMAYSPGDLAETLLYEYRKDAATYILLSLAVGAIDWVVARHESAQIHEPAHDRPRPSMLKLSDGATHFHAPLDEIDLLEAAGNYVQVYWGTRQILHRATLASLEEELGDAGFVRIHRSRLVRRAAIRRIETQRSGDFTVGLASGAQVRGSRRFRDRLGQD